MIVCGYMPSLQIFRIMFVEPAVGRIQQSILDCVTSFFLFKMYKDLPYEILEGIYGVSEKTGQLVSSDNEIHLHTSSLSGCPRTLRSGSNSKRFF